MFSSIRLVAYKVMPIIDYKNARALVGSPELSQDAGNRRSLSNVGQSEETVMPKFMVVGSYTQEGAKGVAKEGGTARRAAITKAAESVGGKVEAVYFAFGENDFYVVLDLPDSAAAAALSMRANQTGMVRASLSCC